MLRLDDSKKPLVKFIGFSEVLCKSFIEVGKFDPAWNRFHAEMRVQGVFIVAGEHSGQIIYCLRIGPAYLNRPRILTVSVVHNINIQH